MANQAFELTPLPPNTDFIRDVQLLVNQLWGLPADKKYVPCPLPCNLERKDLKTLKNNEYLVTPKLDGIRMFLLMGFTEMGNNNYTVLIDRAYKVYPVGARTQKEELYNGTLLDGELVYTTSGYRYLVFDAVCKSGYLLRTKMFTVRIDAAVTAVEVLEAPIGLKIDMKPYFYMPDIVDIWDDYKTHCDGLIFQPLSCPLTPGNQKTLFKWKPLRCLTIDFYVSFDGSEVVLEAGSGPSIINANQLGCYWDYKNICSAFTTADVFQRRVMECTLTREEDRKFFFMAIEARNDKVYANDAKVVTSTLIAIRENITVEEMLFTK